MTHFLTHFVVVMSGVVVFTILEIIAKMIQFDKERAQGKRGRYDYSDHNY